MRFFVRGGVEIEENLFGCPKIFTYRRPSSDLFLKSETVHSRLGRGLTSVKGDIVGNLLSFIVLLFWFNFIKNKGQCWDWRRQLRQMDIWYFHSIARNKIRCWDWRRHLRQIDGYLTFPQYQRHADAAAIPPSVEVDIDAALCCLPKQSVTNDACTCVSCTQRKDDLPLTQAPASAWLRYFSGWMLVQLHKWHHTSLTFET